MINLFNALLTDLKNYIFEFYINDNKICEINSCNILNETDRFKYKTLILDNICIADKFNTFSGSPKVEIKIFKNNGLHEKFIVIDIINVMLGILGPRNDSVNSYLFFDEYKINLFDII